MIRQRFSIAVVLIAAFGIGLGLAVPPRLHAAESRCFPETEQCLGDRFRTYWEQHGGLAVFGLPLTPAVSEATPERPQGVLTQWLERNRLELHPANAAPYDVLLGRIGAERLEQRGEAWQPGPYARDPQNDCLWFAETRHAVCDQTPGVGFKSYWQQHGLDLDRQPGTSYQESLALFGLPLTEARMETNSSGDTVLTQWFERARLEWHPQQVPGYQVLLGRLGAEVAGTPSPTPDATVLLNGTRLIVASDRLHGRELWRGNGSPASWSLVRDIHPGPASGFASLTALQLQVLDGRVYFAADDGQHGIELWSSDGTTAGTRLVKDINAGAGHALDPFWVQAVQGQLFFGADDGVHGRELWRSDGSAAGTRLLTDIYPGPSSSQAAPLAVVNNRVVIQANDGTHGAELWWSDSRQSGAQLLLDLNPGPASATPCAGSQPCSFIARTIGTMTFLSATNGQQGAELWRTDGTAAGTVLVKDIKPGVEGSYPADFAEHLGALHFTAIGASGAREPWLSDGTAQGTNPR
jgi:ELWxxDGT repeat protein